MKLDVEKLRRLAEEAKSREQRERELVRAKEREEAESQEEAKRAAQEKHYQWIIENIPRLAEEAAQKGQTFATVMTIPNEHVHFQRVKIGFLRLRRIEYKHVPIDCVDDPVALRVYAYCKRAGLNPQIDFSPSYYWLRIRW